TVWPWGSASSRIPFASVKRPEALRALIGERVPGFSVSRDRYLCSPEPPRDILDAVAERPFDRALVRLAVGLEPFAALKERNALKNGSALGPRPRSPSIPSAPLHRDQHGVHAGCPEHPAIAHDLVWRPDRLVGIVR